MVDVAAAGAGNASKDPNLIPPHPPTIPPNVKPGVLTSPKYSITSRKQLLANHFKLTVKAPDSVFYQYSVHITSENKKAAQGKGIGRKLVDRLYQTYSSKLADNKFVYDKEKAQYTIGPLPQNKLDFTVPLEEAFAKRKM
ncbi:putative protein argonaute [Rosa chinensis]|uniref:Protein argonaute N-terminal domain-containing protein n=1 Tax=Rosa chinensis TaxID=74649 RepID=A0A2P6S7G0_ROSCH|nr:putative protein argonaute [Rosa chinensis]